MQLDILSDLVISGIRSVSTIYNEAGARGRRQDRPCWGIMLKYEGETVYESNGKRLVSDREHLILLPRGIDYEWQCTASGHCIVLEFDAPGRGTEPVCFSVKNSEPIRKLLKETEYKRTLESPMEKIECLRNAYEVLLKLGKGAPRKYLPSEKQQKIEPALEYMAKNPGARLRNEHLAAMTGLSTVYFRKLFAEVTGRSPMEYLREVRIRKAKEMLLGDYGSVGDVALALGYPNICDFSRTFKKQTGVSPLQYRKTEGGKIKNNS